MPYGAEFDKASALFKSATKDLTISEVFNVWWRKSEKIKKAAHDLDHAMGNKTKMEQASKSFETAFAEYLKPIKTQLPKEHRSAQMKLKEAFGKFERAIESMHTDFNKELEKVTETETTHEQNKDVKQKGSSVAEQAALKAAMPALLAAIKDMKDRRENGVRVAQQCLTHVQQDEPTVKKALADSRQCVERAAAALKERNLDGVRSELQTATALARDARATYVASKKYFDDEHQPLFKDRNRGFKDYDLPPLTQKPFTEAFAKLSGLFTAATKIDKDALSILKTMLLMADEADTTVETIGKLASGGKPKDVYLEGAQKAQQVVNKLADELDEEVRVLNEKIDAGQQALIRLRQMDEGSPQHTAQLEEVRLRVDPIDSHLGSGQGVIRQMTAVVNQAMQKIPEKERKEPKVAKVLKEMADRALKSKRAFNEVEAPAQQMMEKLKATTT
jgi:hypothetical protein